MSSMNNNENENIDMKDLKELERIDQFVSKAPGSSYTIDQKEQTLCREGLNGQRDCVKLNLEYTQMFSQMQKLGFFCALPMDPTETYMECRRV
ncbi:hypothetical protein BDF20DRAFT_869581 [Mycotypha africana]|uniref:uncharacterized protein n=1 Tax=Mycotypha africana TaxID=64632 RepID=UPI002301E6EB|nr:uncharacterized protein BDF20DRAFT_869581 [Mycotypha africana]KAI8979452.1 hypothetical protein BDF20DRAFT_869581 [Mycotypha africana]